MEKCTISIISTVNLLVESKLVVTLVRMHPRMVVTGRNIVEQVVEQFTIIIFVIQLIQENKLTVFMPRALVRVIVIETRYARELARELLIKSSTKKFKQKTWITPTH